MAPDFVALPASRPNVLPYLRNTGIAVLLLGALAYWSRPLIIRHINLPSPESPNAADPCDQKPRCLVVYVAPWCPSCRSAAPMIADIRFRFSASPKVGVKLVVGMDERPKLDAYARELGAGVFVDPGGQLSREAGIHGVPNFLVLDSHGKVLERVSGFYGDADIQIEKLGLDPVRLASVR